jgi:NapH/MauN family ferredoxin-type protein
VGIVYDLVYKHINKYLYGSKNSQKLRNTIQLTIVTILVYEGWQFYLFVSHFRDGTAYVSRPPAIEAFLPISALVGLKSWISTGLYDTVHPAGLAIFLAALLSASFFARGFCSWLCPIGALSEFLGGIGKKISGKKLLVPQLLDYPLRSIKYLILAFFIKAVLIDMSGTTAYAFINSPYNKVVDVKMLDFWIQPGTLTILVTCLLVIASLFIHNFWCRYLCPYGALLGVVGIFSPLKIVRESEKCTSCSKCSKVCPSYIKVESQSKVSSQECIKCFKCIENCPSNALHIWPSQEKLSPILFGIFLTVLFFSVLAIAKISGHWYSEVSYYEYSQLIPKAHLFTH